MRRSSDGVVIDPSTSETSYGPRDDRAGRLGEGRDLHLLGQRQQLVLAVQQGQLASVAGGELPHREAWASHSSSTSRSGRRHVVTDHRTVPAQQQRAELAVPAPADAALHVALQRHPDVGRRHPLVEQGLGAEPHHRLRAAQERRRCARTSDRRRSGSVTKPVSPSQPWIGTSTVWWSSRRESCLPALQFGGVEEVALSARTGDQHHPPVAVPVGQRAEYHRAQRCQADTAGDDHQVASDGLLQSPTGAERPAHAQRRPGFGGAQCGADRTDRADGVGEGAVGPDGSPLTEIATSPTPKA